MNGIATGAAGSASSRGFALITALLMLVILTLLGVSMMSGVGLQEKISSNTREKTRAFDAAQAALVYAQNQLALQANPPIGGTCSGTTNSLRVCLAALSNPTTVPWANGVDYTPSGMTVSATGGSGTYYAQTQYYIQDLGGTSPHLYRITAQARGGNANAVAVVSSVFQLAGPGGGHTPAASVMGP